MAKCKDCEYCAEAVDGDEESFSGHAYVSNISYGHECGKGHDGKFNYNDETNCKHFKKFEYR
jgi:hypothetical protein